VILIQNFLQYQKEGDDDDDKYGPKFDKQFSGNAGSGTTD
jgi:hypothetical protein